LDTGVEFFKRDDSPGFHVDDPLLDCLAVCILPQGFERSLIHEAVDLMGLLILNRNRAPIPFDGVSLFVSELQCHLRKDSPVNGTFAADPGKTTSGQPGHGAEAPGLPGGATQGAPAEHTGCREARSAS
jgi:hypothetical protein